MTLRENDKKQEQDNALTYIPSGRQVGIYEDAIARVKESPLAVAILEHKERNPNLY